MSDACDPQSPDQGRWCIANRMQTVLVRGGYVARPRAGRVAETRIPGQTERSQPFQAASYEKGRNLTKRRRNQMP